MNRWIPSLAAILAPLALSSPAFTQEKPAEVIAAPEVGIRWRVPDVGWTHKVKRGAQGLEEIVFAPEAAGGLARLSLRVSRVADSSSKGVKDHIQTLRRTIAGNTSIHGVRDFAMRVAGRRALGLEVLQRAEEREFKVHLVFLRESFFQYRIQFHAPRDRFSALWKPARRILKGLELVELSASAAQQVRLRALAARCGSQVEWAPSWEEAARRAERQKRLIVVSIFAQPGFELGNRLDEGVFMSREILDLMKHRFVGVKWKYGDEAPFVDPQVFGLGRNTFGVGLLICAPTGAVLRQVFALEPALVADALRETLVENAELAPPPAPNPSSSAAGRVAFLLASGQLQAARETLGELGDESLELLEERLRLHLLERDGEAAARVLALARKAEGAREEAAAARLDFAKAAILIGSNRLEAAQKPLNRCLAREKDAQRSAQASLWRGMLAYAMGRREQARKDWMALTRDHPEQPDAWAAAALLLGPALKIELTPSIAWPGAREQRLARLPAPAAAVEPLDLEAALEGAVQWLLESQRPDGSWDTPAGIRNTHPAPHAIHLAAQAICVRALVRTAALWRTSFPLRAQRCKAAALKGLRRYLSGCQLAREHPRPVAFMDYTAWRASYGLFCLFDVLDPQSSIGAALSTELRAAIQSEARHLVAELVRVQAPNGGWSYYLSGSVGGAASDTAMSFTSATVLLALEGARARGFGPPAEVLSRGIASLERLRGTNGMFEYMRQGPSRHAAGRVPPQGSAGRGPVCTLALQRAGRLDDRAMVPVLMLYVRYLRGFGDQSRKALMHAGPYAQGSHYLLYDYSSAAEALRLSNAQVVDQELRRDVRDAILRELARCRSADGSFVDNPLIGAAPATAMAVLALVDLRAIAAK